MEKWRKHKKVPGYLFSNLGRIMNLKGQNPKITFGTLDKRGYRRFKFENKFYGVHRLIAECFIPNPENYDCIDHKDGNKENNSTVNLEWVTAEENVKRYFEDPFILYNKETGEEWQCRTQGDASKVTGLSQAYISLLKSGKRPQSKWVVKKVLKKF